MNTQLTPIVCDSLDLRLPSWIRLRDRYMYHTLGDLVTVLENSLNAVIDNTFKSALSRVNPQTYALVGGKAINLLIRNDVIPPSFDFDLHTLNVSPENIMPEITSYLNSGSNLLTRYFIGSILHHQGLILPTTELYANAQTPLFYWGYRMRDNRPINSIFLRLVLHVQPVQHGSWSNIRSSLTLDTQAPMDFLLPIADIMPETNWKFDAMVGPQLTPALTMKPINGISYANPVWIIFNLYCYILFGGFKLPKNYHKFVSFFESSNYTCFSILYQLFKFETISQWSSQMNPQDLRQAQVLLSRNQVYLDPSKRSFFRFDLWNPHGDIVQNMELILRYIMEITNLQKTHRCGLKYDTQVVNLLDHFLEASAIQREIQQGHSFAEILIQIGDLYNSVVSQYDQDNWSLFKYTCNSYWVNQPLEMWTYARKISPVHVRTLCSKSQPPINLDLNENIDEHNISDYWKIFNGISQKIQRINTDPRIQSIMYLFQDSIMVYRFVKYFLYYDDLLTKNLLIDPANLQKGHIVNTHSFLSTTIGGTNPFISSANTLFKIRIPKNSPNWILIGKYSAYVDENEILINKGVYLVVTRCYSGPVRTHSVVTTDLQIVECELADTRQKAQNLARQLHHTPMEGGGTFASTSTAETPPIKQISFYT